MDEQGYRIFVFRHGQTDWNREGRIQGHTDVPLNEAGRAESHRLALGLRHVRLDAMLSSDLSRAADTARLAIAEAAGKGWHPEIPVRPDSRLREVHFGALQGMNRAEIREKYGDALANQLGAKVLSDELLRDIGSESAEQVLSRFFAALEEAVASRPPGATIGIATHGGVVRRLLHYGAGLEVFAQPVPNATLFPFRFRPEGRFLRLEHRIDVERLA
jgi:probable phosphoglycerate mutase